MTPRKTKARSRKTARKSPAPKRPKKAAKKPGRRPAKRAARKVARKAGRKASRPTSSGAPTEALLLRDAGPRVAETYQAVKAYCQRLGPMTVEPSKSGIQFRAERIFATLKPTAAYVRLEFVLDRMVPDSRINEMTEHAPDRLAQAMTLRTPVDLDGRLQGWLKEAYMKAVGGAR